MNSADDGQNFTDEQKRECCLMISIGCDRETACNYLGKTAAELRLEIRNDAEFGKQLLRAEATPEFNHMRNLYQAAKDAKHWRASVWWLERRAPERYARRLPDSLTTNELCRFVEELAEAILSEVNNDQDRRRLLARLIELTDNVQEGTFDHDQQLHSAQSQEETLKISQYDRDEHSDS